MVFRSCKFLTLLSVELTLSLNSISVKRFDFCLRISDIWPRVNKSEGICCKVSLDNSLRIVTFDELIYAVILPRHSGLYRMLKISVYIVKKCIPRGNYVVVLYFLSLFCRLKQRKLM